MSTNLNVYRNWGFSDNPFSTKPLPANSLGKRLLIGREGELKAILNRLGTPPQIPALEGVNGIGKTSLVNVALFEYEKEYSGRSDAPFFPTCKRIFQIRDETNPDDFFRDVIFEVAQVLISKRKVINRLGHSLPHFDKVDRWMNSPEFENREINLAAVGGIGYSRMPGGLGFEAQGFKDLVLKWLELLFAHPSSGGVVCVLDNIEILRKSERARQQLEDLRDIAFSVTGIRWIISGAHGVTYSIARSPRLEGILSNPIVIRPLREEEAPDLILHARLKAFATGRSYCPVTGSSFRYAYALLRKNIRNTLGMMNNFCLWTVDQSRQASPGATNERLFFIWLDEQSNQALAEARGSVSSEAWKLFERIAEADGRMRVPDERTTPVSEQAEFSTRGRELLSAGLIADTLYSARDARRTLELTSRGHLVKLALVGLKPM